MRTPWRARESDDRERQRGQGLVETALVLPIVLLMVASVAELGFMFQNVQSLVYGSRDGARVGSALARGDVSLCVSGATDPSNVDGNLVAAVQRILQSPDSGIKLSNVQEIRIFEADDAGAESGPVNIWTLAAGPTDIDPDPVDQELIAFGLSSQGWPACSRVNNSDPDSIGVTVVYRYDFVMPLGSFINAVAGGAANVTLRETTVMALNPTV